MAKKAEGMLELLEAALAQSPLNVESVEDKDGASRTGGKAAQKRRVEDEGGAGAAGRRTSDAEEAGEHNGKVLPPKRKYAGVHDATGETKAEQDAVRAMVENEWVNTRDAEEQQDEAGAGVKRSKADPNISRRTGKQKLWTKEGTQAVSQARAVFKKRTGAAWPRRTSRPDSTRCGPAVSTMTPCCFAKCCT